MSENILNDIKMLLKTELLGIREEIKGLYQELEEFRIREEPKPKEMIDNATEARSGLEKEATGTVQYLYLIRWEEIKPISWWPVHLEFKAFISNRLADEEEITRFNDDRAKISSVLWRLS